MTGQSIQLPAMVKTLVSKLVQSRLQLPRKLTPSQEALQITLRQLLLMRLLYQSYVIYIVLVILMILS